MFKLVIMTNHDEGWLPSRRNVVQATIAGTIGSIVSQLIPEFNLKISVKILPKLTFLPSLNKQTLILVAPVLVIYAADHYYHEEHWIDRILFVVFIMFIAIVSAGLIAYVVSFFLHGAQGGIITFLEESPTCRSFLATFNIVYIFVHIFILVGTPPIED